MKTTNLFSVGTKDLIKGLIVSVLTVIVTMLISMVNVGNFPVTLEAWKPILLAGLGSGLAYILKNFLTTSDDKFLQKETNKPE